MKTIVCYGDSNTYGYNPHNGLRYDESLIWPSLLKKELKEECVIYNEGLNGRTTAYDRDNEETKNGLKKLAGILNKYSNIDILIFMLGTNDCNYDLNLSVLDIAKGMETLIIETKKIFMSKQKNLPTIIVVAPERILDDYKNSPFAYQLNDESINKSKLIGEEYKKLAEKYNCLFLDAKDKLEISPIDCEHLTINGHQKLARLLGELINNA